MQYRSTFKTIMILSLLTQGLVSCTFSSPIKSSSIPLSDEVIAANSLAPRGEDVYLVGSEEDRTFASVVEECRETEMPSSLKASTRRLLVGLKEIEVLNEEKRTYDNKPLLVATSKATLDSLPILIKTYSMIRSRCVIDIVLWTQQERFKGNEDSVALNIATSLRDNHAIRN